MALDIELGAEFIYMAATLISALLCAAEVPWRSFPRRDPRQELVEELSSTSSSRMRRDVAAKLMIEENVWSNPQIGSFADDAENQLAVTLFDLVTTLGAGVGEGEKRPTYEVTPEEVSVPDMISS